MKFEDQGWISVDKKLPKERKYVDVCCIHTVGDLEEMKWRATGNYQVFHGKPVWNFSAGIKLWLIISKNPITHWKPTRP